MTPLRALVVEDSEDDALLLASEMRRGGCDVTYKRVETAEDMKAALVSDAWDVVISDYSMPHFSAPGALRVLNETGLDLPFIIVSGTVGEDVAVEVMRAGAHDYLLKGNLTRLVPAVRREIEQAAQRKARCAAEERTHRSEERFRRLFDSNTIGIIIATVAGELLEANDFYLDMLGYTREDLLAGKIGWDELTPPEYRDLDRTAVEQLRRCGAAPSWEKELFRKDGTRVPILIGVAMLEAAEGSCIAYVVDLSKRRALEAQLRQAQKMDAIGRLAGGIAHDFNNILTAILGYGELASSTLAPDSPLKANLDEIHHAAQRAAGLTRQLLIFSRKQVLQPKILDLNAVVEGTERLLRRLIGEDVTLVTALAAGVDPVRADPGQLEQVVLNLAVNARDAMPRGGRLTIETANVDSDGTWAEQHPGRPPGRHVLLAVADSGTGMDEATKNRIFEPFFTTKEAGKGTGLGLATVFGIVEQAGGLIEVDSEPGRGTKVRIYLPSVEGVPDSAASGFSSRKVGGTETVLVVEDEDPVRRLITKTLQAFGYEVLETAQPAEALRLCREHPKPIHLLLTDIVMPGMNGRDLAGQCCGLRADVKVVFMSGYTADAMPLQGIDPGMHFLSKPFTPSALASKVREVLDAPEEKPAG